MKRFDVNKLCMTAFCVLFLQIGIAACYKIETDFNNETRISHSSSALTGEPVRLRLCQFSIYGTQKTDLRDRTEAVDGFVGSGNTVEVGSAASVTGDIFSSGGIFLRGSTIDGNVTASGTVVLQNGTTVSGSISENKPIPVILVPTKTFESGVQNFNVYAGQTLTLAPGRYGTVQVYGNGSLHLQAGTYELKKLIIEASNANLTMDTGGGPIVINVKETLRFGNQMKMHLVNGNDPKSVQFYLDSTEQVVIGTDLSFFGQIRAPRAEVVIYSRVTFNGSIHAYRVIVDTDSHIIGVGCEESENGYSPGLDMMTRPAGIWWPDYRRGEITSADGLSFAVENMEYKAYAVSLKMNFFGPQGATWTWFMGTRTVDPDGSATFFVAGKDIPMRSETSAMQAQPEITINREGANDETRTAPPIYFMHIAGTNFSQIELFDEQTLISQRDGKLAWGTGATVSPGDLLGYVGDSETREPIIAGEGESSRIYNDLGEVVGYRLGSRLR